MEGMDGNPALHHSLYATQGSNESGPPETVGPEGWLRQRQQPRPAPPGFDAAVERPPMARNITLPATATQAAAGMLSNHDQKVHRVPSPGLGGNSAWSAAPQDVEYHRHMQHQQSHGYPAAHGQGDYRASDSLAQNSPWARDGDSQARQMQQHLQQQQLLRQQIQQQQVRQAAAAQGLNQQQQQALLASMYRQQQAQAQAHLQRTAGFPRDMPQLGHASQHLLAQQQQQQQQQRHHQHVQPQGFPHPQSGVGGGQSGQMPGQVYGKQPQQFRQPLDPQIHAAVQAALQTQAQSGGSTTAYLALQQLLAGRNLQGLPPGYGSSVRPHNAPQPQYQNLLAAAAKAQAEAHQQQQNNALLQHIQQLAQQRSAAAAQAQAEIQARAQRLAHYHANSHQLPEESHLAAAQRTSQAPLGPHQVPYRHASPSLGVLAAAEPKPLPIQKDLEVDYQPPGSYPQSLASGRAPGRAEGISATMAAPWEEPVVHGEEEGTDSPPTGSRLSKYHAPGGQQTAAEQSLQSDTPQLDVEQKPAAKQLAPLSQSDGEVGAQQPEMPSEESLAHHAGVDDSSLDAFNAGRFAFFDGGPTGDGDLLEALDGDSGLLGDGEGEDTVCAYEDSSMWDDDADYMESRGPGGPQGQDLDGVTGQLGGMALDERA